MPFWHRAVIAAVVFAIAAIVARLVDWRLSRRLKTPETITRYRVVRRSVMTSILVVGLLSALLVIPQVRAVAGGLLASSAVLGLVIGLASQRTIGNFVAGLLIAFTQPLRLGDRVEVAGVAGEVEEIGLTYTFIRADDETRLVIPNEKLASDAIRNATIRSPETLAQASVQVPLTADLGHVVGVVAQALPKAEILVTGLEGNATVTARTRVADPDQAERVASSMRVQAHERLREAKVFA